LAVAAARAQDAAGVCNAPAVPSSLGQTEEAFINALNAYRQSRGLAPLAPSALLRRAALHQAAFGEQTSNDFDSEEDHVDNGRTYDRRFNDCGYDFIASKGENLATFSVTLPPGASADQISPAEEAQALLDGFKGSPRHEQIQTDPRYRAIGVARVVRPSAELVKVWWAVTFGSVTDEAGVRPQSLREVVLPSLEEEPCIPPEGADACDDERLALWRGETDAWAPRIVEDNQPVIPGAVLLYTLRFRADAGGERSRAILRMIGALP
jgi:uncharacterized protein YkwD